MNQDGEQLIIEIELQIKRFFNKNNYKKKNKIFVDKKLRNLKNEENKFYNNITSELC